MEIRIPDGNNFFKTVCDTMPLPVFVVDEDVRIIDCNRAASSLLTGEPEKYMQAHGGVALNCIHSTETAEGCGHADACKTCIIRDSVISSFSGRNVTRQKHMIQLVVGGEVRNLHLHVTTAPFEYGGNPFVLLMFEDITELMKAEGQINQQKKFLSAVLDSLPHPFYVIDAGDYRIKYSNRMVDNNTTCYDLTHKSTEPCRGVGHSCPLAEVRETRKPVVLEHIHYDSTGDPRIHEVHGYPIFDDKDNVIQMIEYSIDITERKQIEDDLHLYGEIIANIAEGVFLIRVRDGVIAYANPKFERMFQYASGELIGKHFSIFYASTDKSPEKTVNSIINTLHKNGIWHGEARNLKKDGTPVWCNVTVSTFEHKAHGTVWVAIHQDISDRKLIENEREKIIGELKEALDNVKQLSGLLPICASCKNIRDDKGYWNSIEKYITQHSEVLFTHGLCPECVKKLYPKTYEKMFKGEENKND